MKKFIKNNIFGFIIGIIFTSGISVLAVDYLYNSKDVSYNDKSVKGALDDLYNLSTIGDATATDIISGKTALVKGKLVTGTANLNKNSKVYVKVAHERNSEVIRSHAYLYIDNVLVQEIYSESGTGLMNGWSSPVSSSIYDV